MSETPTNDTGREQGIPKTGDPDFDNAIEGTYRLIDEKSSPFGLRTGGSATGGSNPGSPRGWDLGGETGRPEHPLVESITAKASKTIVFGHNLAVWAGGRISDSVKYTLDHKAEVAFGAGAGAVTKLATRAVLVSTGGIAMAAAAGAAGGAVSGAGKEYLFKQRADINARLGETDKTLIIGGLKNEFRRMKLADKRKIAKAAAAGAVVGAIGGVVGAGVADWLAHSEAVQKVVAPVGKEIGGILSHPGEFARGFYLSTNSSISDSLSQFSEAPTGVPTSLPLAFHTATGIPSGAGLPADTALPTATHTFVPTETATPVSTHVPTATPTEAAVHVSPPSSPLTPAFAEALPAAPAVPKPSLSVVPEVSTGAQSVTESIKLPAGSNTWNEMQKYLSENLHRIPEPQEIQRAVDLALNENHIPDPTKIPADTMLKVDTVREYLNELGNKPPLPSGAPDLGHTLPDSTPPAGPDALPAPLPIEHPASIPPTEIHGHMVSGSVADHNLTYDGKPWVLLDNGTKNIGHLFEATGETSPIDQQVLAAKLQEATTLWAHGQLNPAEHGDLYRVFHLSNGTASIYNKLLDDDETLETLKRLGIIGRFSWLRK